MTDYEYDAEPYEPTPAEIAAHEAEVKAIIAANPGVPLWALFQMPDLVTTPR